MRPPRSEKSANKCALKIKRQPATQDKTGAGQQGDSSGEEGEQSGSAL